jgi:hypothetical protein
MATLLTLFVGLYLFISVLVTFVGYHPKTDPWYYGPVAFFGWPYIALMVFAWLMVAEPTPCPQDHA